MQQRGTFAQKASGPKVETEEKIKIRPRSADRAKRRNPLAGTGRRRRFKYTLKNCHEHLVFKFDHTVSLS